MRKYIITRIINVIELSLTFQVSLNFDDIISLRGQVVTCLNHIQGWLVINGT